MTDADSLKIAELANNPDVLITYAAPSKNRYVVVSGTARSEHSPEKARELWNIHAKAWYPPGPDDPGLYLLRVHVTSAEYWDGPSNTSYLLNLAVTLVTGKHIQAEGEHGNIRA